MNKQLFQNEDFVNELSQLIDKYTTTSADNEETTPKPKRWRDDKDAKFEGYLIEEDSTIVRAIDVENNGEFNNIFATEAQAKSALAMARISQIMANDKRFGGVVTDEGWNNEDIDKYTLNRWHNEIHRFNICSDYHFLAFHTAEQCDLFLKENEDLVKDYLMI